MDQNFNDPECSTTKYEPRLRPWYVEAIWVINDYTKRQIRSKKSALVTIPLFIKRYRTSTSVPKVIVIFIDRGLSMNNDVLPGQEVGTFLANAKRVVAEFVINSNSGDFVNIIMFDSTKVSPLSPTVSGTSDVAQGINAALENFGTDHPDAAKIILIFTDASANTTMPVTNLTALNVKVFVYKIPLINDDKLFIGSSDPFGNQLCPIGGSFEVISKFSGLSNPLLALNAFFTSTAALHAKVTNNSADYSPICPGYEQIDGNITTVSMPVFRADKTLIRVVGMDININNLGSLTDSVQAAILARIVGKGFKTSHFMLTRADCSLQTALLSAEPCTTSVANIPNGGFCPRTDQTSKITDLACCESCKPGGDDGDNKELLLGQHC